MSEYFYNTIEKSGVAEFNERGSQFIAYAFPIQSTEDFKTQLKKVKKEHPKATHHCFAYRLGIDKNVFRMNDDGEPPGTAGKTILNQIDSKQLTNILIIVVRYFGGTLLGVPGLINAYKAAAALCLQVIPFITKPVMNRYILQFDYTLMNDVMTIIKTCHCSIVVNEAQIFCRMVVDVPLANLEEFNTRIENLYGVEVTQDA